MVKLTTEGRPVPPRTHQTNGPRPGPTTPPPGLEAPLLELVKADPPAKPQRRPGRVSIIERARPMLEQLMADGETAWHRIALYPKVTAASQPKGRLAKAYGEFEWQVVRLVEVGQSAIYVRWLGATKEILR